MDSQRLKNIQEREFFGWDFQKINEKTKSQALPWDYKNIVKDHLKKQDFLLDMGTGGGEFLLSLKHPYEHTYVTEAYPPNINLCEKYLCPLGIKLYKNKEGESKIPKDQVFDVIINRHDAYHPKEVYDQLRDGGYFITQQVGGQNNHQLSQDLLGYAYKNFEEDDWDLNHAQKALADVGFHIEYADEALVKVQYFDLETLVAYASIISWEFPGFEVSKHKDQLKQIEQIMQDQGYIEGQEHRFILVAKK